MPHVSDQMRNASQWKLDVRSELGRSCMQMIFLSRKFYTKPKVVEETRPDALAVPQVIFHSPTRGLVARQNAKRIVFAAKEFEYY
jgi:hypothetical protein